MKVSVCIDMMFGHYDFYDRFEKVKDCNIDTVEFWKWSNKDIDRVKSLLEKYNMNISLMNIDVKDEKLSYDLSRGILNAGRTDELVQAIGESAPVCKKLGCKKLIVLIGETIESLSYDKQLENIYNTLVEAEKKAREEDITLVIEPLNDYDRQNYFMPYSPPVFEILKKINSPYIKMLFDIYHQQKMEGNVTESIKNNIERIGHIHVADNPGRHEPGTGELNYPNILKAIEEAGYTEYVGLEYRATKPDEETLGFLKKEI
ncbi:MAG: TIM barrel protein [Bacillota bacterium]|nr:TIM barrel protein [Bacillota bacterium]